MSSEFSRRKVSRRVDDSDDDDNDDAGPPVETGPPPKRLRIDSPQREPSAEPVASTSRTKSRRPPKKRPSKTAYLSDPDSEDEFADEVEESEVEAPVEDEDEEYMSEPHQKGKKGKGAPSKGGGKTGKDTETTVNLALARDQTKKRGADTESAATPTAKRPKPTKVGDTDASADATGSPAVRDAGPPKKKLPTIKKNKDAAGAAKGSGESKLPALGVVAARKQPSGPQSSDVDLSNPAMYAALFSGRPGGPGTPTGNIRRDREEERRKELLKMRDEAKAKRLHERTAAFDLQGQMDKIIRFEEKLRDAKSPAVWPNHLAGGLKQLDESKSRYPTRDVGEPPEEGEV
ncbi:Fructose-1,6-bisphosphatase [Mycena kentingensis (nom. inval.)]|nr:Fructose-1,6-bisphosphatase [Mycena kentingensis (nom. inval.)]